MMKSFVYIDAENISKEEFSVTIGKIREMCTGVICGKFYGNKDKIGGLLSMGYEAGFEFVETSSIVHNRKNVTDMKITVDCITDVLDAMRNAEVFLVSNDCDFVPLFYKLRGLNVDVYAPLMSGVLQEKSIGDLEEELKKLQYDPRLRSDILSPQYDVVKQMLPDSYSDALITDWFTKKKRKFLKDLILLLGEDAAKEADLDVKEFSFLTVCERLGIKPASDIGVSLLKSYTQKCFGFSYPERTLGMKVSELQLIGA